MTDEPEEKEFKVSTTVFSTVKAHSQHDANFIAAQAVKHVLNEVGTYNSGPAKWDLGLFTLSIDGKDSKFLPGHVKVDLGVFEVMDTGMAAGNGYLWLEPTGKAFPRKHDDE